DRHRLHRPVRLREVHLPADAQPHARGDPRRLRRGLGQARRRRPLRPRRGPRAGAPPGRHGVPAPEPVPHHVDRRQRAGRRPAEQPADVQRQVQGAAGELAAGREPVERGQGPARQARVRPLRRPAAAAVHRPRHRRPARGHPHGRAVLGARPHLHARHRGPDRRAQGGLHGGHRHPQHAAGRPGERPDGVLQPGRPGQAGPARRDRLDGEDLLEPEREGHRGLHHRPVRL
ncbi:MAG: Phosphate transport ATP-binding protein PstB, partial [uncultured Friedmanniella sp.]